MLIMTAQPTAVYHSRSKINLGLEVLSKRKDGYHNINTLFYRLDSPSDILRVSVSNTFQLSVNDLSVANDSSNLIVKAIERCSQLKAIALPGIEISLEKYVPIGAGLGGGSADAATAIEIFSDWVSPLTPKEKFEIARSIGADVPFFLMHSYAALASGIGDVLIPIDFKLNYPMVLLKPKTLSIPTDKAYQMIELSNEKKATDLYMATQLPIEEWDGLIRNDFEEVAFTIEPSLAHIKERLISSGATFSLMSGSGSAFFGIYQTLEQATKAYEMFRAETTLEVFINNNE